MSRARNRPGAGAAALLLVTLVVATAACGAPSAAVDRLIAADERLSESIQIVEAQIDRLDPEAQRGLVADLRSALAEAKAKREIVRSELDLLDAKGEDLGWMEVVAAAGATALATFLGVEMRRGSPTNRKGLPPKHG